MSKYFNWTTSLKRFIRFDSARANDMNAALDELTVGLGGLEGDVNRSLKLPIGTADQTLALAPGVRANKVVAFDASGNITVSANDVDSAGTSAVTAVTQAGIATTQAGIATTQAGNAALSAADASSSASAAAISAASSGIPSIAGNALRGLRVNAAETGVEFANTTPPGPRSYFVEQFTSSTTFTVPAGVFLIRPYAFGAGAAGTTGASGGGGGCAYGDIAVTPAQAITLTISGGVATVTAAGVAMLTANPASGITGGTASRNGAVTNAGNFSGGAGFSGVSRGGASSGSPLGIGVAAANAFGGSGWGGAGAGLGGGGVGGAANDTTSQSGPGLSFPSLDPLLDGLIGPSVPFISATGLPGILGSGGNGNGALGSPCGAGSFGAGGGGSSGAAINGGAGGFGGGGGGGGSGAATGGAGGFGGGGGSAAAAGGAGGAAVIRIYY